VITIEKGIPFPSKKRSTATYPLGEMEVGDSFVLPVTEAGRIRSAASWFGARHQKKFASRHIVENGEAVLRVWRTE
jgi:hypothetical protein